MSHEMVCSIKKPPPGRHLKPQPLLFDPINNHAITHIRENKEQIVLLFHGTGWHMARKSPFGEKILRVARASS